MKISGARRIMRAIYIDMTSITFCSNEMLKDFSKIEFLDSYISQKQKDFEKSSNLPKYDSTLVSSRYKLTNIGIFRIYLERYLAHLPTIREDMTVLVRQLPTESRGLPMEICAFASETDWILFENIQSDVFDHIYAIAPTFGLRLFQEPTGNDMHSPT
jgi:miniconductance mechanosensitive channel